MQRVMDGDGYHDDQAPDEELQHQSHDDDEHLTWLRSENDHLSKTGKCLSNMHFDKLDRISD